MSTSQEPIHKRPGGSPPDDRPKERLNVVIAASGDQIFEIPLKVAQQYIGGPERVAEFSCVVLRAQAAGKKRRAARIR